jgi:N-acetyl sugar amidotransferase
MNACSRCIYDERIPGITFDSNMVCSYCKIHDGMCEEYPTGEKGQKILKEIAEKIKRAGRNKKYDCVVGVSGGCDSSYLTYLTKEKLGLRPLAVHFDNTYNTMIATQNIHKVLKKLDVELYTYVVDNEEFDDLARSFLKASVPEIDSLTDVALATTLYIAAEEYGVKYIFNAHNFRTEGITPIDWFYFDGKYIQSVHKEFGALKMDTFPNLWLSRWMKWLFKGIKRIRPIYYANFKKEDVKKFLNKEFSWQWYGGHHQENRYTIFSNRYILPNKFNIDFRYVEFSALIRSGQMKREDALREVAKPPKCPEGIVEVIKKRLGFTDEEFEEILKLPKKSVNDFKTYRPTFKKMRPFFWLMYKADLVPKSFYIKYTK